MFGQNAAVSHNLQRQAWPALLNTVLVRSLLFYPAVHPANEGKEIPGGTRLESVNPGQQPHSHADADDRNRDVHGCRSDRCCNSRGSRIEGTACTVCPQFVLRINFVGIGRFVIAIGTDVGMGLRRASLNQHRLKLYEQQLSLILDTRLYYQLDSAWVAVERADQIIGEMGGGHAEERI